MKIQARKCGFTHKLFESESEYVAHLRKLRTQQQAQRAYVRTVNEWEATLDHLRHACVSPQELQSWMNLNMDQILVASVHQGHLRKQRKGVKLQFEFQDMQHHGHVRNSHGAPRGGVRNWHRNKALPMGYPGWQGHVVIKGWDKFDGFCLNLLEVMMIHTGSGGCGEYSVYWFDADWPGMVIHASLMKS